MSKNKLSRWIHTIGPGLIVTVRFTNEKSTEGHLTFHRTGDVGLNIQALNDDGNVQFLGDIPNEIESSSGNMIPRD
jgi:hypothetical protein